MHVPYSVRPQLQSRTRNFLGLASSWSPGILTLRALRQQSSPHMLKESSAVAGVKAHLGGIGRPLFLLTRLSQPTSQLTSSGGLPRLGLAWCSFAGQTCDSSPGTRRLDTAHSSQVLCGVRLLRMRRVFRLSLTRFTPVGLPYAFVHVSGTTWKRCRCRRVECSCNAAYSLRASPTLPR